MAPTRKHAPTDHFTGGIKSDRKMRKPLVEKKRRARINDSLHELRALMADTELHYESKMENAEVLEMTVKRVEGILQHRAQEAAACERFAAGYIQCMHDVHTFVSGCPGMEAAVAAELLNHLLESMPLHGQERLRATLSHADQHGGARSPSAAPGPLVSPAPSSSSASSDDLSSDLEDTDSEQSQVSSSEESEQSQVSSSEESEPQDAAGCASSNASKSLWRPW